MHVLISIPLGELRPGSPCGTPYEISLPPEHIQGIYSTLDSGKVDTLKGLREGLSVILSHPFFSSMYFRGICGRGSHWRRSAGSFFMDGSKLKGKVGGESSTSRSQSTLVLDCQTTVVPFK